MNNTANTFTSMEPDMKGSYADGKPRFSKIKEKLKGQNKPIRKCPVCLKDGAECICPTIINRPAKVK